MKILELSFPFPVPKAGITVGSQLFPDEPSCSQMQALRAATPSKSELAHKMNPHSSSIYAKISLICELVLAKRMVPYAATTWFPREVVYLPL